VLETPHVVVAAAIAVNVANPALAIPLALGSHFVLEKVPHWNPHLNTELKKFGKVSAQSTNIVIRAIEKKKLIQMNKNKKSNKSKRKAS